MLALQARVDLGAMAMKRYSTSHKAPVLLEPHHQIVLCLYIGHALEESYSFAEKQSVYSTAPADCASHLFGDKIIENCFKIDGTH